MKNLTPDELAAAIHDGAIVRHVHPDGSIDRPPTPRRVAPWRRYRVPSVPSPQLLHPPSTTGRSPCPKSTSTNSSTGSPRPPRPAPPPILAPRPQPSDRAHRQLDRRGQRRHHPRHLRHPGHGGPSRLGHHPRRQQGRPPRPLPAADRRRHRHRTPRHARLLHRAHRRTPGRPKNQEAYSAAFTVSADTAATLVDSSLTLNVSLQLEGMAAGVVEAFMRLAVVVEAEHQLVAALEDAATAGGTDSAQHSPPSTASTCRSCC